MDGEPTLEANEETALALADDPIKSMWGEVRPSRPPKGEYDPFVVARESLQLELDV